MAELIHVEIPPVTPPPPAYVHLKLTAQEAAVVKLLVGRLVSDMGAGIYHELRKIEGLPSIGRLVDSSGSHIPTIYIVGV